MGMFIQIKINTNECQASSNECRECINICPVDVFQFKQGKIITIPDNEDECTLCSICEERCPPKAIKVVKLY
ncbi:MAG: 4Fe-4S binding protein [Candidatus Aerophobetes bacterium]|nr:4Fe-4S binding protein [Candidatus Aerophobetes bacterium]